MKASTQFIYNEIPYPSFTFPQTNPERLAVMAKFHGMDSANPEKCRFLELGCGDGANLLSLAYLFPESQFVGLDLSKTHIADAKTNSAELGLSNTSFHEENLLDFDEAEFCEFDYIVAHGVYSWVPEAVREKILNIYSECLTPHGVGYISYNAYPGCHIRESLWEMMKFHVGENPDSLDKVQDGINIIGFLTEAAEEGSLYQSILRNEFESIKERRLDNIFHDEFSEMNQPFYFHEFVSQIEMHGLQFLSESDTHSMSTAQFAENTRKAVNALGTDIVRREQYLDFIKFRRFRSSLVCRNNIDLNRHPSPEILKGFRLLSAAWTESEDPNIRESFAEKFVGPLGGTFQLNHPLSKAALSVLKDVYPYSLTFDEVIEKAGALLGGGASAGPEEREKTGAFFLEMFDAGFLKLQINERKFVAKASEFPVASLFARWQAKNGGECVTTLTGANIAPDKAHVLPLLMLLDGTRDRAELCSDMLKIIEVADSERDAFIAELPKLLEMNLDDIANCALLEA